MLTAAEYTFCTAAFARIDQIQNLFHLHAVNL
jgi:hypothetical protein